MSDSRVITVRLVATAYSTSLLARFQVSAAITLYLLPAPGQLHSSLTIGGWVKLLFAGLLGPTTGPFAYSLRDVTTQGQELPDIEVEVASDVQALGIDGVLGLDFFGQFSEVRFDPSTATITLVGP